MKKKLSEQLQEYHDAWYNLFIAICKSLYIDKLCDKLAKLLNKLNKE